MELCLEPGQSLLVYSDGVSEATNRRGEEYGVERLRRLIGGVRASHPESLVAACRDDLAAFRGNQRSDDVTLFALSRQNLTPVRPYST